jgi:acrylyl-CoA reductase (NADPH)
VTHPRREYSVFKAIWLEQEGAKTIATVKEMDDAVLSDGDTMVDVEWSTVNFKDALAITGKAPVVRKFPMIPGIDFAGKVRSTTNPRWSPGDSVILTGWGYGEQLFGGLSQRACVSGDMLVRLPEGLSTRSAMAIGTAGFTAMLAVLALERHGLKPDDGEVLVTGAGGGVGGFAIALLARRGYKVVAATGRPAEGERLLRLGAAEIIGREPLTLPGKPMVRERWAGVIDSLGSFALANACAATRYGGVVAACGLAQGMDFPATVAPFILRGVTLVGIDSVQAPMPNRTAVWDRLAQDLESSVINELVADITLDEVVPIAADLLGGRVSGRVVVALA